MEWERFLRMLLSVVFVAQGILGFMLALLYLTVHGEMQFVLFIATLFASVPYLLAGYGLAKGSTWGWALAVILTVFDLFGSIVYKSFLAMMLYATIFALLIVLSGSYGVRIIESTPKPSSPVPPPSQPVAELKHVIDDTEDRRFKFVRRKR